MEENYVREITEIAERTKSNTHRIDNLEIKVSQLDEKTDDIHTIATSMQLMSKDFGYMRNDITKIQTTQTEMQKEISEVKQTPVKAKASIYDKVIIGACAAIGTGVLMFILNAMFPAIFK